MKKPVILLCVGLSVPLLAPSASAKEMCGPPGYRYPCPPKPPAGPRTRQENEQYRDGLEAFRKGVEKEREQEPGGDLEPYREALEDYYEGMDDYRRNVPE